MPKKLSQEEFIERAKSLHENKYVYTNVIYKNSTTKVSITCPIHGDFLQIPKAHLKGQGCKFCGYECNAESRTTGLAEFIRRSKEIHNDKFDYSKVVYINSGAKVIVICPKHGEFAPTAQQHISGVDCAKCYHERNGANQRMTTEEFITKAENIHGKKYDYSLVNYIGNENKVTITCPKHGEFLQRPNDHLSKKAGCPACGGVKRLNTYEFIDRANLLHEGKYGYDNTNYTGTDNKILITCTEHGDFLQTPHDHLSKKAGCPDCVGRISKGEIELFEFVQSFYPDAIQCDRTLIRPLELDIVVPSKNIAFEFNGLYYHSSKFINSSKHKEKLDLCSSIGYRLINVYEDDWRFNKEVVKKTIKHILGFSDIKYYARKLSISVLPSNQTKQFFEDNHMQGSGSGNSWCLVDRDNIVAAMQFGMATSERGNKDSSRRELIRYATVGNIVGGASRLFKAFLKDNPTTKNVISYSDNDMFSGKMYELLGFIKDSITSPDYKYIVSGRRVHKSLLRKSNIAKKYPNIYDESLSEFEMTQKLGLFRIYNSGLTKWIYSNLT